MNRYKDQFKFRARKCVIDPEKQRKDELKKISADILADTLQEYSIPDDNRAVLVEQLANFLDQAKSRKANRPFKATQQPIGRSDALKKLKQLDRALSKVLTILESMDLDMYRLVDRDLIKGDIQPLDISMNRGVQKRGRGVLIPERIATVFYVLAHRLLDHVTTINPEPKKGGRSGDFMQFIAIGLATIYSNATGNPPARRTTLDGQAYGPFYDFVRVALEKMNIKASTERVVRLANDHATLDRLRKVQVELYSRIYSSLPDDLRAELDSIDDLHAELNSMSVDR